MHGRPRVSVQEERVGDADPQRKSAKKDKIAAYSKLQAAVLQNHRERCYSPEALLLSAKLLSKNPDVYTVWNYRKCAFNSKLAEIGDDEAKRRELAQEELRISESALEYNPKSYSAWFHRKWLVSQNLVDLQRELKLLKLLLTRDTRNFHGWDYRRFVARKAGASLEGELQYTMEKINEDFKNYSAWHNRSHLLADLHQQPASPASSPAWLEAEYQLVRQAFYTGPEVQSAWIYYLWLLGQTVPPQQASLIATWPAASSRVCSEALGEIPVVLCFNAPVEGIDEKNVQVTIRAEAGQGDPGGIRMVGRTATWRPVGGSGSSSTTWAADVQAVGGDVCVRVAVSASAGIKPAHFDFHIVPRGWESGEGERGGEESLTWPSEWEGAGQSWVLGGEGSLPPEAGGGGWEEGGGEEGSAWVQRVIGEEVDMCRDLLSLEPGDFEGFLEGSKWTSLTLARLLVVQQACGGAHVGEEPCQLYCHLAAHDSGKSQYHMQQVSKLRLEREASSKESLARHWWTPARQVAAPEAATQDSTSPSPHGWLRLTGLELGTVEGIERLLWVRCLDLSANHLRSASGLEAMQRVQRLDLSRNRMTHTTALAPLLLLPYLRHLNLAHNRIGETSVDTLRFSFPSAKSNSQSWGQRQRKNETEEGVGDTVGQFPDEVGGNYICGMLSGLAGLQLESLEMRGNVIVESDGYKGEVRRVVPTLKWMDGDEL